ncbi:MAG: hypothetical protein OEM83_09910, partial [Gammaproteobacteria bacterium]|nr:hypothetical protein [Gammaproteobacteria bacterium]
MRSNIRSSRVARTLAGVAGLAICLPHTAGFAAVLPEQRVDAMYHYYDGGGVRVTGPALLVRK